MLRITFAKKPDGVRSALALIVEGRLEGPWVSELSNAWQSALARSHAPVEVELDGMTYASESGAELLRSMRTQGASFATNSSLAQAWVQDQIAEVTERILR